MNWQIVRQVGRIDWRQGEARLSPEPGPYPCKRLLAGLALRLPVKEQR